MQESLQFADELQAQAGVDKSNDPGPSDSRGSKVGSGRAVHAMGNACSSRSALHVPPMSCCVVCPLPAGR